MNRRKLFIRRILAGVMAMITVFTMSSVGIIGANGATPTPNLSVISQEGTFAQLLLSGISSGAKGGVTAALTPMISLIGQELFGLPADSGLTEIRERLAKIEGQLEEIRAELAEGFEKVIAELEKNEQLSTTIDTLAQTEFLANIVMNFNSISDQPQTIDQLKDMSGEEQRRIVEINAEAIKAETVNELYLELQKAKGYLANGGYIDSNYNTAYDVYYNYMKKQSMFCGEAAMKSEFFWETMKESYAKSCIALIYALEQQLAMYDLSEAEPSDEIRQEAIDAAIIVTQTLSTRNVIENNLKKVKADAKEVLDYYYDYLEDIQAEATVFINKGDCYIELNPELGRIDFDNCNSYEEYTQAEGFEKGGITKELYEHTLKDKSLYFYNIGYNHIDASTVSFEEFINNSGICTRYDTYRDADGPYDVPSEVDWSSCSRYVFKPMMLNLKATKYNTANKPEDVTITTIIDYIMENCPTKSIAQYLADVGFSFGDADLTQMSGVYMPTANFETGNGSKKVSTSGKLFDITALSKDADSFENCIGNENPEGTIFFFENAKNTIGITIDSIDMDGRIYNGVYTIEAKRIVDYNSDGTPVYIDYKAVYEVEGDEFISFRLPVDLDYKTIKVTLGYEGLGASSNHKNLCSFSLSECEQMPENLTLKMEGYTKIWLGYGVHAEILCDGMSVAKGEG